MRAAFGAFGSGRLFADMTTVEAAALGWNARRMRKEKGAERGSDSKGGGGIEELGTQ